MPEYLAPGVFVEEVSFRAKTIEGVPTSTTGFAGMTRYGPVRYPGGPIGTEPRLVTSFVEFERIYGRLAPLVTPEDPERLPYLAHAARAFFLNGGSRLYVSRVHQPPAGGTGVAEAAVPSAPGTATWRARWPGAMGNVLVTVRATRSGNVAVAGGGHVRATGAREGSLVEVVPASVAVADIPRSGAPLSAASLRTVHLDTEGVQSFVREDGSSPAPATDDRLLLVELEVSVRVDTERLDQYVGLGVHPANRRFAGTILSLDDPEDEAAVVWLDVDDDDRAAPITLAVALAAGPLRLRDGADGPLPPPTGDDGLEGEPSDPDDATKRARGLHALAEIDDIAIVAVPDGGTYDDEDQCEAAAGAVIRHAEACRYRIAVVDGPRRASLSRIREFRGRLDSSYGALYHPWVEAFDPTTSIVQGAPPTRILLPPSGFVAGIYARNDVTRGVHKAPANEVVYGLTRFADAITTGRQEVLNPEGINALRALPGRGNRVWGARTATSDPEWKYVNVRRLFIYLEHSIDKATQWAVFEPNNEDLWRRISRTILDFLEVAWRGGALLGATPEQAFFVRCDRTTMTQNDLDNGRLICLVGVAPTYPAEFVIFRIGQWTADARS